MDCMQDSDTSDVRDMTGDDDRDHTLSFDAWDELQSPPPAEVDFDGVVDRALSRRGFLGGLAMVGGAAFLMGTSALTPARAASRLAFDAVAANTLDTITVPSGYRWQILAAWGDPLWSDAAGFDPATRGTSASQERAFGDNNDGMALFADGSRSILAVNNEYTNLKISFGNRPDGKPVDADDVRKGKAAHGVSVMEVAETDGEWSVVKDSPYNRRITADTPMEITGPARGHDLLKTAADPSGTQSLGT